MGRPQTRSSLTALLKRIAGDLDTIAQPWAVVGGLAVHAHTRGGSLDDIDIAVEAADDPEAERIVKQLQERGFVAVTDIEQQDVHRLASVRLGLADEPEAPSIQLLFASSGIEPEVARDAGVMIVLGLDVPVASRGHLVAMKVLSRGESRPQDAEDLALLLKGASPDDLRRAEVALDLMSRRGFSRGLDLRAELGALVSGAHARGA